MLARVGEFGTTPGLPANASATALFPQVKGIADEMSDSGMDQSSGHGVFRGGASDRLRIGSLLRQEVRGVVKVARVLDPVTYPGVAQEVRGPSSSSYQALLASARAILERVTPIKAAFVERGLPANFDETMSDLIDALEEATLRKFRGLAKQTGGTAGLAAAARRGVKLVKELDAIMTHVLRNDPALQASWKTVSRIQRDDGSSATTAASPSEPSSPTATA